MPQKIQWGILSTGAIAHKFATGLSFLSDAGLAMASVAASDCVAAEGLSSCDEHADKRAAARGMARYLMTTLAPVRAAGSPTIANQSESRPRGFWNFTKCLRG